MIYSILIGALAGWLAGRIMGAADRGLLRDIIVGVVGSAIGSFIFRRVGFYSTGILADLIVGVVGACLFIWLIDKLSQ